MPYVDRGGGGGGVCVCLCLCAGSEKYSQATDLEKSGAQVPPCTGTKQQCTSKPKGEGSQSTNSRKNGQESAHTLRIQSHTRTRREERERSEKGIFTYATTTHAHTRNVSEQLRGRQMLAGRTTAPPFTAVTVEASALTGKANKNER